MTIVPSVQPPTPLETAVSRGLTEPDLSVVVPVFEEAESVGELHAGIAAVLESLPVTAELIFVDDGSRDETLSRLHELYEGDARVKVVSLRRNFGKTAALL